MLHGLTSCGALPWGGQTKLMLPVLVSLISTGSVYAAFAGPYKITVRSLGSCPISEFDADDDLIIQGVLHSNRSSKEHQLFNGYGTVKHNVLVRGESMVKFDIAKWDTVSGWRENFWAVALPDFCFLVDDIGKELMEVLAKHIDGYPRKCPIPNRTYNITNTPSRIGQLRRFPVLPYGRFRAYVIGAYSKRPEVKKPRFCIKLIVDLTEKFVTAIS
ncbi:uncharacterized protein LOC117645967 [Thrips palmi]|uniref:Uncharacterized protein LOC117645967 n=1 Tax=Thrips palmi TaxID=161013 RepID=A0A6P8YQZ1_THRPL|nr:uncharacterized protein LOC117645967 [Thrips palmi]